MLMDRRNTRAAYQFLGKALKTMRHCHPCSITTDKLGSYPKAIRRLKREGKLWSDTKHRTSKYLNNIIEADHGRHQARDSPYTRLSDDEDSVCHDQRLRDHVHDSTPPLHPLPAHGGS
jgi:transposase-like protein